MSSETERGLRGERRWLLLGLVILLGVLCAQILRPFVSPMLWAAILAASTWRVFEQVRRWVRGSASAAAGVMTALLGCAVILPVLWLLELLPRELGAARTVLNTFLAQGSHPLPPSLRTLPWLGERLQAAVDRYSADPTALAREASNAALHWSSHLGAIMGSVGHVFGVLLFTLLTLFVLFSNGDELQRQARLVTRDLFGERLDHYVLTAVTMTRAVVQGMIVTACVQGVLGGIGYWFVGLGAPVLLAVLTAVCSTVPLAGTALVWAPVGLWLLSIGQTTHGFLLLGWGALIVYPADNVVRPLLISSAAHVPFFLVLVGALGGLSAFGVIGIVLGPVVLAVGIALWRAWVQRSGGTPG